MIALEKDMLAKTFERSAAQHRVVWRLGCKNRSTPPLEGKTSRVPRRQSLQSTLLEQIDDL